MALIHDHIEHREQLSENDICSYTSAEQSETALPKQKRANAYGLLVTQPSSYRNAPADRPGRDRYHPPQAAEGVMTVPPSRW
jgi:hypothetical protein